MLNSSSTLIKTNPLFHIVNDFSEYFVEENLFQESFDNVWIKLGMTASFVISSISCSILLVIAFYERDGLIGHYRTVINQLVSIMNIMAACYVGSTTTCDLIRMWIGPLPQFACDLNFLVRAIIGNTLAIVFTQLTIFKFLFICVWKKIPMMNDDLLAQLCTWIALVIGGLLGWIKYYLPGRLVFNQVYCYGLFYESWEKIPMKFQVESYLILPSLGLVGLLSICVTVVKFKAKKMEIRQSGQQTAKFKQSPISLSSLTLNLACLAQLASVNFCMIKLNNATPMEWVVFPYNFYSVTYRFLVPCTATITLVLLQIKALKSTLKITAGARAFTIGSTVEASN